ncbi:MULTISPECIES: VOC family protein [unclassified Streptomyces]|uniref:VOC family protein n=1 Tax=unclassified Streptomyces TaxID=2593676 RepID=UPI002E14B2CA|nr:VOC family protein [Streptomyces sp. NBC_01205]
MTSLLPASQRTGIPTARSVDHFAFTVPDLDQAVEFFTTTLGGELVYRLDRLVREDDWMSVHLDVDPRATAEIAMLRLGPTSNIELFEYTAPTQNTVPPRNNDVGGHHLAFYVDDVDAAVAYLSGRPGVRVLGTPQEMPEGSPNAGDRWIYFLTPWGMQMEVHSVPQEMPYHQETDGRRFGPVAQWHNGDESAPAGGIPTVRNVDHVAYTVADLDASVAFFTEVLGAELLYRIGPLPLDADVMSTQLNVHGAGTIEQAMLRLGPTDNIELFSYGVPGSSAHPPRNSDVGGHHLAFYVDDVDAAVAYLRAQDGVEILGEPETIPDGPIAGDRWVYFRTPIGIPMEVLNMPDGAMPYEAGTPARRCDGGPVAWTNRP